jgi:clan AA aspartic protease
VIPLTLLGGITGESRRVEAVIATGFTDRLTLPPDVVEELRLPLRGSVEVVLADGSVETLPMYFVRLIWHGDEQKIRAYSAAGDPLVGMALLSGSELRVQVRGDGRVEIEELPA